jgi:hypothetical protein
LLTGLCQPWLCWLSLSRLGGLCLSRLGGLLAGLYLPILRWLCLPWLGWLLSRLGGPRLGLFGLLTAHLPWLSILRGLVGLWLSVLVGRNLTRLVLARLPILRRRLGICAVLQVLAWLVGAGCVLSGCLLVLPGVLVGWGRLPARSVGLVEVLLVVVVRQLAAGWGQAAQGWAELEQPRGQILHEQVPAAAQRAGGPAATPTP